MRDPTKTVKASAERAADADARAPLRMIVCGSADAARSMLRGWLFGNERAGIATDASLHHTATARRAFVVADIADGELHARGMATAAAKSDLAVILVDARGDMSAAIRRQAIVVGLMGVRSAVLAVDFDPAGFERTLFDSICGNFRASAGELGFAQIACIPLSARDGDNVITRSTRNPWYAGPTLLEYLETVDIEDDRALKPFRIAVQSVDVSPAGIRLFAGALASGNLRPGDEVAVLPSGQVTTVKALIGPGGALQSARAGDAVTIALADGIDVIRGDILSAVRDRAQTADQFAAHLIWLSKEPLLPGRSYLMEINHGTLAATVTELKHRIDVNMLSKLAAKTLALNEIGVCNLSIAQPIAFDPFADNRETGAFILLDRYSNETVAAGIIDFALRRANNIHHQTITISKAKRAALKHHKPAVLWFTGLSAAGKSTIANRVEAALHARGIHTLLLDGDNIRHGLNRDLGFTEVDRVENIRRIGEVAKLMTDAGLIVLCSFISPFRAERSTVRELLDEGEFVEIFVDTPLDECIARDPKGLYKRALAGEIKNFTGVDQPYEAPENPELRLEAGRKDADRLAHEVIEGLTRRNIL
jgi:bifunctional enzyme CysN/CysC